ncbi:MAG: sulfite exporter TauE/SafE family protein [Gammaproteobacteria bacterium]|nr:sulfite exporter TauE/SafE family protein [Gammaproteobacteria bacterium]
MDLHIIVFCCLAIGAFAGFLGGLLGIGGGIVVVPALVFLFDFFDLFPQPEYPENTAILMVLGTSLGSIIFTASSSSFAQWRKKAIDWTIVKSWIVYLVGGAFLASFIATSLPSGFVKLFIGIFITLVAMTVLFEISPNPERKHPNRFYTAIMASIGGVICGLAGIGGGNVVIPTLLFFNTQLVRAMSAASTMGMAIALSGSLGYILAGLEAEIPNSIGYIYLPAVIPLAVSCTIFAYFGVQVAHKINATILRKVFGILMLIVAARMVYSAV